MKGCHSLDCIVINIGPIAIVTCHDGTGIVIGAARGGSDDAKSLILLRPLP